MIWLCPNWFPEDRGKPTHKFTISVVTPWLKKHGQRIPVRSGESLQRVLERIVSRAGAPLLSDVELTGADGRAVKSVEELQPGGIYRARVITNELVLKLNVEGKQVTTRSLGCDRCLVVDDQKAPGEDDGRFTPSASRLALAVLGNIDGQIYSTFWDQMRRVLKSDTQHLRIDKFKSWHSIRRIPLFACRGWSNETVQCLNDLFVAPNRTYSARRLAHAIQESRVGHTRGTQGNSCVPLTLPSLTLCSLTLSSLTLVGGTYGSCALNVSVDISETKGAQDEDMVAISTTSTQLGFACDLRDMALYGIQVTNRRLIIEFGAGFGGLPSFLHKVGFQGRYIVYDLVEIAPVQRYTLSANKDSDNQNMDFRLVHDPGSLEREIEASESPSQGCLPR